MKQIYASYVGLPSIYTIEELRRQSADFLMEFFPEPVLRKPTKRGRLRYEGKLRARERIRRLYAGE